MALRSLRPAGNPILPPDGSKLEWPFVSQYQTRWVNSGTAALALAIIAAKSHHSSKKPEVILPTYGCPDLVAAAVYAGVRAILVDIQPQSPHFKYTQLRMAISPNTVAIVAPTLLGVRADEQPLREIIGGRTIALIEDSAQWFPHNTAQTFFGDYVVLSFGRGKPINILGGGALLAKNAFAINSGAQIEPFTERDRFKYRLRIHTYNTLIKPAIYGIVEKIPFLHIGQTVYHPLSQISTMSATHEKLLPSNIVAFQRHRLDTQRQWRQALSELATNQVFDVCNDLNVPEDFALLRYPVLIKTTALRDAIYVRLRKQGLGASIMYGQPLMTIPGISERTTLFSIQKNAEQFASRLLTLPTHEAVTPQIVDETMTIFKSVLPFKNALTPWRHL